LGLLEGGDAPRSQRVKPADHRWIGYLPSADEQVNLFFQVVITQYETGAIIMTFGTVGSGLPVTRC
jgi:hypothetical protein